MRVVLEDTQDVGLLEDQPVLTIDQHLGAGPFAEQHAIADLNVERPQRAVLVARSRPDNLTLLIDTYDTQAGARKVVALAPALAARGITVRAVRLDSGDLIALSKSVRRILDAGGASDITIFASGGSVAVEQIYDIPGLGRTTLQAALAHLGKVSEESASGPVVVTVFDRDRLADYQRMVSALRAANIRAELYLGNPKNNIGTQLKYADKRSSPCAIIQGGDEKARGEVQIKDLILGATLAGTKDREEYLKKQAEAQFAVKEGQLVAAGLVLTIQVELLSRR